MKADWEHIVLDRVRTTLNLLRKTNIQIVSNQGEEPVQLLLKDLQNEVRYRSKGANFDAHKATRPFLRILRARNLSGPFIISGMESLTVFLECNLLMIEPSTAPSLLADIVDTVISCKFIHTDPVVDISAQLLIQETLRCMVNSSSASYMSVSTIWKVAQFCFTTMISTSGIPRSKSIYEAAESTVTDLVRHLLRAVCNIVPDTEDPATDSAEDGSLPRSWRQSVSALCALTAYFVDVITNYSTDTANVPPPPNSNLADSANSSTRTPSSRSSKHLPPPSPQIASTQASGGVASVASVSGFPKSPSQQQLGNQIDHATDSESLHLLFALKMVHFVVLCEGNSHAFKQALVRSLDLYALVSDDLCLNLLLLCGSRRCNQSPAVLQLAVSICMTLLMAYGSCLRIFVERLFRQVYLKALIQVVAWFGAQASSDADMDGGFPFPFLTSASEVLPVSGSVSQKLDAMASSGTSTPRSGASAAAASTSEKNTSSSSYRLEALEIILESLCDVLSDLSTLPSLFISFDCSPIDMDIVQPLISCICKGCCLVLTHSSDLMTGPAKESGILLIQAFKQVIKTFSIRQSEHSDAVMSEGSIAMQQVDTAVPVNATPGQLGNNICSSVSGVIRACRKSKHLLAEAARLFAVKPEKGFSYLQKLNALPSPLTPECAAMFLRIAQDVPKECVGSYLGELGSRDANVGHESKAQGFHAQVLVKYVESFNFDNMPVLDCLRTFLSAFRLPGEAQQIDRILVAFSEHCHAHSLESTAGILQNSEVTYLLSFSIIMLNTDRHNPNIRADRRMTMEQFVRNNTNYGRDVSQTIPIPRDYLESIFTSINNFPIRTEQNVISSLVTNEEWMHLHMQVAGDVRKAVLISTAGDVTFVNNFLEFQQGASMHEEGPNVLVPGITAVDVVDKLLHSGAGSSSFLEPRYLSAEVGSKHWIADEDMLSCLWKSLLQVGTCVHIHHFLAMRNSMRLEASFDQEQLDKDRNQQLKKGQLRRLLDISNDFLFDLLQVCSGYQRSQIIDSASLILMSCSGLLKGEICEKVLKQLLWDPSYAAEDLDSLNFLSKQNFGQSNCYVLDPILVLHQLHYFESVRSAMTTALTVIERHQSSLSCWCTIFCFLGALHDCGLLPLEMVVDGDGDALPVNVRSEFELKLVELEQLRRKQISQRSLALPKPPPQSSSLLSLLLFGGAGGDQEQGVESSNQESKDSISEHVDAESDSFERQLLMNLDALSARWDIGYESATSSAQGATAALSTESQQAALLRSHSYDIAANVGSSSMAISASSNTDIGSGTEPSDSLDVTTVINEIRALTTLTTIDQLVSNTKFLSAEKLLPLVQSLVSVSEVKETRTDLSGRDSNAAGNIPSCGIPLPASYAEQVVAGDMTEQVPSSNNATERVQEMSALHSTINALDSSECFTRMAVTLCHECESLVAAPHCFSTSCLAWLEMMLVDLSLRNRDRFNLLWPLLRNHYIRTLSGGAVASAPYSVNELSYVTERRVTGLLKISTRMISREHCAGLLLDFLGKIFVAQPRSMDALIHSAPASEELQNLSFAPMSTALLMDLSNQLSAGIWALLTLNVEILPQLPLEQWQTLFAIISLTASAGSYAAMKSFEVMAWLLHEPRLIAKVPVFCIIGVKPLLRNKAAPLSVSLGAVHLLSHLHSRLEVLIKDEDMDDSSYDRCVDFDDDSDHGDAPVLWESCWTPILKALAEGSKDDRTEVRDACANALCQTILDKHAKAVPAAVLMDVLGNIFVPMMLQVADGMISALNKDLSGIASLDLDLIPLSKEMERTMFAKAVQHCDDPEKEVGAVEQAATASSLAAATLKELSRWPLWACAEAEDNVLEHCLASLCKAVIVNLKKLSSYPSFDKLWLRLLFTIGFFIEEGSYIRQRAVALSGSGHGDAKLNPLSIESRQRCCSFNSLSELAKTQLSLLMELLKKEGVFDARMGLLTVSKELIAQISECGQLA